MTEISAQKKQARKHVLRQQRALIDSIMDYQIEHGAGTIQWGVNIQFIDEPPKPGKPAR